MATTLGELLLKLSVNSAEFKEEIKRSREEVHGFGDSLKELAETAKEALEFEVLKEAAEKIFEFASEAAEAAERTGVLAKEAGMGVQAFSSLEYAANQAGISSEDFGHGMDALSKSMLTALEGNNQQSRAFKALGISITDSSGKLRSTGSVMDSVANRFSRMKDGTDKTALAMAIFGRSGAQMIPFLNEGAKGIDELRQRAEQYGLTLSQEVYEANEAFIRDLGDMKDISTSAGQVLAAELEPGLHAMVEEMLSGANATQQLNDAMQPVTVVIKTLISLLLAAGGLAKNVGMSIGGMASSASLALHGDLQGAVRAWDDADSQIKDLMVKNNAEIDALWKEQAESAKNAADGAKGHGGGGHEEGGGSFTPNMGVFDVSGQKALNELIKEGKKIYDDVRTPLEKYVDQIRELEKVAGPAGLSQETIGRAVAKYREELDKANKPMQEGLQLLKDMRTPQEVYGDEVQHLVDLLNLGYVSQDTFNRTLESYRDTLNQADGVTDAHNDALKDAQQILTDIQTPQETYAAEIQAATRALQEGLVSQEQFSTALEKYKAELAEATQETDGFAQSMDKVAKNSAKSLQSALASLFESHGSKKGMRQFWQSISGDLNKSAGDLFSGSIMDGLFGSSDKKGGNQSSGLLGSGGLEKEFEQIFSPNSKLYSSVGKFFSSVWSDVFDGSAQGSSDMTNSVESFFTSIFGGIFGGSSGGAGGAGYDVDAWAAGVFGGGLASGGPVDAGTVYQVAEEGPEIFSSGGNSYLLSGEDGTVTPMSSGAGGGGGGGSSYPININMSGGDNSSNAQKAQMVATIVQSELIRQQRPGGLLDPNRQ